MSNNEKSKYNFDTRDVGRILLSFGTLKVAYDGNIPGCSDFYSKFKGQTKERTSFFAGATDKDIFIYAMCIGKNNCLKDYFVNGEYVIID